MPILGQNAIAKSIFLLIWVPPPLLNNVKQLQLWRRSTSLIHITIAISTIIGIIGTSLHLGKCWFSNIKKRNQLQKLNVSRANLLNSWKNTFFYGRQSYTLLFNFGKYKTIAAATELPTCKTNCPAVRRTLHTARPLRRAGATFPLGAVCVCVCGESNDMMSSESSARNNLDASTSANKPFLASIASPSLLAASRWTISVKYWRPVWVLEWQVILRLSWNDRRPSDGRSIASRARPTTTDRVTQW